ncbi:cytochrome P450 [Fomitiporia mediterranea MF3/22]|uniref:cytochrome P450 n=1 Tax=Fomitiporia mediterranea (strain MF3/22) TaxID=694068 RepID=UPI0004408630|nr:cytochrome P450 [Fomitiporia mediterranea MF3/22]EJD03464.1 cytochrome P450 [Fomitiporia mediterranea MF3/22]
MSLSLFNVLLGAVTFFLLLNAGIALRRGYASLSSCPQGGLIWFHPQLIIALVLAPVFPPRGWFAHYNSRFHLYAKKGSTILSGLWVWYAKPMFWVADVEALKTITSDRYTFTKDIIAYSMVDIYGKSLVSTEGNEWRRHVAVAGPAFGDALNSLVWKETLRLTHDWFADELASTPFDCRVPGSGSVIKVDMLSKMTQLTLHVIAVSGFGLRMPWKAFSNMHQHARHSMDKILPFHVALEFTLTNIHFSLVPEFFYSLPVRIPWLSEKLEEAQHAFASLKAHMTSIVESVRHEGKDDDRKQKTTAEDMNVGVEGSGAELLRKLVQANESKSEETTANNNKRTLTDGQLFSNIFTFLLAGHETSAHTLAFAFLLLAIYPDVQSKVRAEVYRIWPSDDDVKVSNYRDDFDKFEYTIAFFRETLRCFPTEPRLIKLTSADSILTARRFRPASGSAICVPDLSFDGSDTNVQFKRDVSSEEPFNVFVPKGSIVVMDIWGLHMNPLVWGSDAHLFRPERFIDTEVYKWPRDGFLAFSSGARGCIGQRFATAEAICVIAGLVRRFEVLPAIDARNYSSFEEFKRVMLSYAPMLTITPKTNCIKLRRLDTNTKK